MPSATCCLRIWADCSGSSSSWMFSPPDWFSMNADRVRELADVVVVRRDARDQRVGPDRLRGALGEVADHQRVVVRAGRLDQQPAEQRLRRVRQLEQLEHGQQPEHVPEHGERSDRGHRRAARRRGPRPDQLDDARQVPLAEQRERGDDHGLDDEDRGPRLDERLEPVAAPDGEDARKPAEEHVRPELERRPIHGAGDDRDDRGHQDGRLGVEEHGRPGSRSPRAAG